MIWCKTKNKTFWWKNFFRVYCYIDIFSWFKKWQVQNYYEFYLKKILKYLLQFFTKNELLERQSLGNSYIYAHIMYIRNPFKKRENRLKETQNIKITQYFHNRDFIWFSTFFKTRMKLYIRLRTSVIFPVLRSIYFCLLISWIHCF